MNLLRSIASGVSKVLGRESVLIKAARPLYNQSQDYFYSESGVPMSTLGEPYRVCRKAINFVSLEADVYEYLKRTLAAGHTVLDIGAFIGLYAILEARLVGPQGRIVAFEPTQDSFSMLSRHLAMNHQNSVRAFPCAVGSKNGEVEFFQHTDAFLNAIGRQDIDPKQKVQRMYVPVVTVDHICEMFCLKPDLMRIDVQGFEAEVLKGAARTIKANPGLSIILELHPQLWDSNTLNEKSFTELVRDLGRSLTSPEGGRADFSPDAHVVIPRIH